MRLDDVAGYICRVLPSAAPDHTAGGVEPSGLCLVAQVDFESKI